MRWPLWLRLLHHKPRPAPAAEDAALEQEAKLREFRTRRPEVHRQINRFAAEVEAALARKQQR